MVVDLQHLVVKNLSGRMCTEQCHPICLLRLLGGSSSSCGGRIACSSNATETDREDPEASISCRKVEEENGKSPARYSGAGVSDPLTKQTQMTSRTKPAQ